MDIVGQPDVEDLDGEIQDEAYRDRDARREDGERDGADARQKSSRVFLLADLYNRLGDAERVRENARGASRFVAESVVSPPTFPPTALRRVAT